MLPVEMSSDADPIREAAFTFELGNEQPINAQRIGRLIASIGSEYKRQTGGQLVVSRLELGSTIIKFVEAAALYLGIGVDTVEACGRIKQFLRFLETQLRGGIQNVPTPAPVLTAQSTLQMLEVAARAGSNIKIASGTGKERLSIEMTRPEVGMRLFAAQQENRQRRQIGVPEAEEPRQIEDFAERLSVHAGADPNQLETIVDAIVEFLRSAGFGSQLPELAGNLESRGLWHIASMVRRHIDPGRRENIIRRD